MAVAEKKLERTEMHFFLHNFCNRSVKGGLMGPPRYQDRRFCLCLALGIFLGQQFSNDVIRKSGDEIMLSFFGKRRQKNDQRM